MVIADLVESLVICPWSFVQTRYIIVFCTSDGSIDLFSMGVISSVLPPNSQIAVASSLDWLSEKPVN